MLDIKGGGRYLASVPILPPSEWFAMECLGQMSGVDDGMDTPLVGVKQLDARSPMQEQHIVGRDALARGVHPLAFGLLAFIWTQMDSRKRNPLKGSL